MQFQISCSRKNWSLGIRLLIISMSHKFGSLFLINYINFTQIDFIIIFQNIRLRLSYSSNLSYSGNIFTNKCSRTTFSHSCRLISVLIRSKIAIKLLVLNPVRINFIIDSVIFNSKSTHSKTVSLRSQILALVRLIVSPFC